jgi:hypothetical protein
VAPEPKRAQKARGEYLGGKPRFGFAVGEDRVLVPKPQEQMALARMRALRSEGLSFRKIAELVSAEGTPISHVGVKVVLGAADLAARDAAA